MAKQAAEQTAAAAGTGTLKTVLIVVGILVLEGATIMGTMYLSGGPQTAQGQDADLAAAQARENRLVEIQLIKKKFFNQRSGRGYYYDTEIYVATRAKHEAQVSEQIQSSQAALTEMISTLFRQADQSLFLEPTYAMLKRKLKALLDERFGHDAEGRPLIEQVLIKSCIPYPADI